MVSLLRRILLCVSVICTIPVACYGDDAFVSRVPMYAASSKLSSGLWVKIRVTKEGMYKITYDELKAWGFKNPKNVRVYGYGGQLLSENLTADYIDDIPEVCTYEGDNYLLFYGVGTLKQVPSNNSNPLFFVNNSYADAGAYFLSETGGKRLSAKKGKVPAADAVKSIHTHYAFNIYMPQTTNIYKGGTAWYDDGVQQSGTTKISLPFSNMVPGDNAFFTIYTDVTNSNDPKFSVSVNGSSFSVTPALMASKADIYQPASAKSLDFKVDFTSSAASCTGYIHYLCASALCYNKLQSGFLCFNNLSADTVGVVEHVVSGANSETVVWNVTNPNQITQCVSSLSADSLRFKASAGVFSKYVAFNPKGGGFLSVDGHSVLVNQNLHGFKGADLVIISPLAFQAQAQRLANLHIQNDGISAVVLSQEQIFNEFSSGTTDPTAIRSFMKMLYDRAQTDPERVAPRYLLLFGDGCFDNKGLLSSSYPAPRNLVLCYQRGTGNVSFPADDYYGMLADNDSTNFSIVRSSCQVAVGRLPFVTAEQADAVVTKIGEYMKNDQMGAWKNKICLLADDNEGKSSAISYHDFLTYAESLSKVIASALPSVDQKKIYHDSYNRVVESSGNRYPDVEKLILENVENGSMLINYIGHSNAINWAAEKTFTQNLVSSLTNKRLGVWFSASCEFSEYDNYATACGESLVLAPNGGAIAVVATSRPTYAYDNNLFDSAFCLYFFSQTPDMTIGDIMLMAKNKVANEIRVKYPLMGDPALHIVFPAERVITDFVSLDTANALSKVVVNGHIENEGAADNSFNGRVFVKVYDKEQTRSTKGNDKDENGNPMIAKFNDYPSVLFSGEAEVVDGEFSFSFIVPNDISYAFGKGRITYYACDTESKVEAVGNYDNLVIGGSLDSLIADSVGPLASVYINSPFFRSGDVVGANPVFIAKLYDENGINASDVGIGHDITLSINGGDPVPLNSNFAYSLHSCTDGTVSYKMIGLADGVYTLTFKVWDLLNNSTTKTLSFVVENGKGPHIDAVSAFPNPALNETNLVVRHDRPLANVDYVVSIYDVNGRFVNVLTGSDNSADAQISIPWNLKNAYGQRVGAGVYIYRVELKTDDSSFVGNSDKIVVLP